MDQSDKKFILIVRHGELDNPENIVYNRDSVMKIPIHLSALGKRHMLEIGQLIKSKDFNLTKYLLVRKRGRKNRFLN
jgi:broad specificity phosphatase PhoE